VPTKGTQTYGEIELTPEEANKLVTYLSAEVQHSLAGTADWRERITLWREFVDPPDRRKTFPWPGASSVFVPLGRLIIDALKAAVAQTIKRQKRRFVADLVSSFHAGVEKDQEFALLRAAEDFAEKVWMDPGYLDGDRAIDEMTEEALTTGMGIEKLVIENDANQVETAYGTRNIPLHVGPRLYLVPTHTWVWPSGLWRSIQEMPWTGHYFTMTKEAVKARKADPWKYNAEAAEKIAVFGGQSPDPAQQAQMQVVGITATSQTSGDPIRLYDISLVWDLYGNGKKHDIAVTFHQETGTLLRVIYNQAGDGLKPYEFEVASPRAGIIPGRGVIEPCVSCIRGINTGINQAFDSQTLANSPCIVTMEESEAATDLHEGFVPGTHLTAKESTDEVKVLKFPDPSTATFTLVNFFMTIIQQLTRINPSSTGDVSESKRTPATLGLAIQQQGSQLTNEYIDRLRDTAGRIMSRAFVLYYLDDPNIFERLLGEPGKLLASVVKKSIEERRSMTELIRIRLSASSASKSIELERQSLLAATQAILMQFQPMMQLAQTALQPPPGVPPMTPAMEKIVVSILNSAQILLRRNIDLSDLPDAEAIVPDIAGMVEEGLKQGVQPQPLPPQPGQPGQEGGVPPELQAALGGIPQGPVQ